MLRGTLKTFLCLALTACAIAPTQAADAPKKRAITLDDLARIQRVGSPVVSPEAIGSPIP
jgi:hypothetical protein